MFLCMNGSLRAWGRRNEYKLNWRGILNGSLGSSLHKGDLVSFQDVMEILSPLGAFLSNSLVAFFFLFMMPKIALGQFSVIGPTGPIQASLRGEAELPCYLSPPQSAQHMKVIWSLSTRVVHLYRDGEDQLGDQHSDYQGRTVLLRDAMTSGNVTLKILDVKLMDAGKYTCVIANGFHQEQADVELKVSGDEPEAPAVVLTSFMLLIVLLVLLSLMYLDLLLFFQEEENEADRS
ncbi:myelin-oligodendrocyte glycoprotein-like isoform X1 [Phascolarctos cinereus]|uniref:Myelin-oligodendrocyte glycoprotein-like isoform X2 n=1 Tax=Phascolarctos cinereus TaxID=38626 RepID=A0A6P5KZD8_PHACI|nr:myelin-oligodendrocyte glycoprotein-like isoform X2 [Phascolarctos cinereus]